MINLGIAPDCPRSEARYYVVANLSLYEVLVASLLFFFFALSSGIREWYTSFAVFIALLASTVLPRSRGWHWVATTASLALVILWVAFVTVLLDSGSLYWLFPISIGAPLMFPPKHARTAWALSGLVLATFGALVTIPFAPLVALDPALLVEQRRANLVGALVGIVAISFYHRRVVSDAEANLDRERERSEHLLLNVLPRRIAERLKEDERSIADHHEQVTVLFADIVGFTPLSASLAPDALVKSLNEMFSAFDAIATRLGLEKIKTIGDAYMVAGGVPEPRDDHAQAVALMALEMVATAGAARAPNGEPYLLRVGLHSGPLVAGVIGRMKFSYDLWGATVNVASRMESHGEAGRIHVSRATRDLLPASFVLETRGEVDVKGVGKMETYYLVG